jgi:hypothetical protein
MLVADSWSSGQQLPQGWPLASQVVHWTRGPGEELQTGGRDRDDRCRVSERAVDLAISLDRISLAIHALVHVGDETRQ